MPDERRVSLWVCECDLEVRIVVNDKQTNHGMHTQPHVEREIAHLLEMKTITADEASQLHNALIATHVATKDDTLAAMEEAGRIHVELIKRQMGTASAAQ